MTILPLHKRASGVLSGTLLALVIGLPALADDAEIYQSQAAAIGAKPNVLFIMDTSGSMDTSVLVAPTYDPAAAYSGSCVADRIYFSTTDQVPSCAAAGYILSSLNTCKASRVALATGGGGVWPAFGTDRMMLGQFRDNEWQNLQSGNGGKIECYADDGVHGETDSSPNRSISNESGGWRASGEALWTAAPLNAQTYRLYSGNYLNFRSSAAATPVSMTRLQIVRDVAINLASSLQNVNLGLMRYSSDADGGMVIQAVGDIATNRSTILSTLRSFNPDSGDGFTPLSETLYEAAMYYMGRPVDYGVNSTPIPSVDASRISNDSTKYNSPIDYQCQKNYIVYLTDGLPTHDHESDSAKNAKAAALVGRAGQSCPGSTPVSSGYQDGDGLCTDELAKFLYDTDLDTTKNGKQNVSTYMIGFGNDVANSVDFLNGVASAGGTNAAYTAADTTTLTNALQSIFSDIQKKSTTFTTPAITINAFNRAKTSDELYFTLFQADQGIRWPGNLKKYSFQNGIVVDRNNQPAVDRSGFFSVTARSYWSAEVDGADVTKGGAAGRLRAPADRKLYTYLTGTTIADSGNALDKSNPSLTESMVGAGTTNTVCSMSALCQQTVDWARGVDVTDIDRDNDRTEQVRFMGDALHGRPGIVSYGGTSETPDAADTVVYVPTNDGFLHAIDAKTGDELWAFMPRELLSRLFLLKENATAPSRSYGLDGDIRVLKFDRDQDGIVERADGDFVWLFFGMRAGGKNYYAVDVTSRDAPKLMWTLGASELPGIGQTWSAPMITRVQVSGVRGNVNEQKLVLVFGGGYDTTQESQPYSVDSSGNRIFMVDAQTGRLLWFAGGPSTVTAARLPDLELENMTHSIAAAVKVIDVNGDSFADRIYAGDMGGRIWRFDIFNGNSPPTLVTGGVLAQLGAAGTGANPANSIARRFYNSPDVALIQQAGRDPYYNIAIGSGYRGHPLNTVTEEHFYSIRDKRPFAQLSQGDYARATPILENNLTDITADPLGTSVSPDGLGWKLRVSAQAGRAGEKVLAESTTFNNVVLFSTFQPTQPSEANPCFATNVNRVYALYASSGKPALDLNNDGAVNNDDVSRKLDQSNTIAGKVVIGIDYKPPRGRDPNDPNAPDDPGGDTACRALVGAEGIRCPGGSGVQRTFWQRQDAP